MVVSKKKKIGASIKVASENTSRIISHIYTCTFNQVIIPFPRSFGSQSLMISTHHMILKHTRLLVFFIHKTTIPLVGCLPKGVMKTFISSFMTSYGLIRRGKWGSNPSLGHILYNQKIKVVWIYWTLGHNEFV